jgi:hypothetical protein
MTSDGKKSGARASGGEGRAANAKKSRSGVAALDEAASEGAGRKKGQKTALRDDDPQVVAASQERAAPMSSTTSSSEKKAAAAPAPESPQDPLYAFFRNIKAPTIPLPAETPASSPFSSSKPLLPDTGPKDPVGEAAKQLANGLKSLLTWRVVETGGQGAASEPDPFWANLKSVLTWKAPEAKREKTMTSSYEPEPNYKVDLLLSAITKSHPDRKR